MANELVLGEKLTFELWIWLLKTTKPLAVWPNFLSLHK